MHPSVINGCPPEKFDLSRPAFQGQSRSLEPTRNDPATYDFLLVIYSNRAPISYHFRDEQRFRWKIEKKISTRVLNAPAEEVPRGIL